MLTNFFSICRFDCIYLLRLNCSSFGWKLYVFGREKAGKGAACLTTAILLALFFSQSFSGVVNNMTQSYWRKICGVTYCFLSFASCLVGFFYIYCPFLPLLLFNRNFFRKITDTAFTAWESFNVSLLEVFFGVQTFIGGDLFRPEENSLILLNHRLV